jgi:hypothetical protein
MYGIIHSIVSNNLILLLIGLILIIIFFVIWIVLINFCQISIDDILNTLWNALGIVLAIVLGMCFC